MLLRRGDPPAGRIHCCWTEPLRALGVLIGMGIGAPPLWVAHWAEQVWVCGTRRGALRRAGDGLGGSDHQFVPSSPACCRYAGVDLRCGRARLPYVGGGLVSGAAWGEVLAQLLSSASGFGKRTLGIWCSSW